MCKIEEISLTSLWFIQILRKESIQSFMLTPDIPLKILPVLEGYHFVKNIAFANWRIGRIVFLIKTNKKQFLYFQQQILAIKKFYRRRENLTYLIYKLK